MDIRVPSFAMRLGRRRREPLLITLFIGIFVLVYVAHEHELLPPLTADSVYSLASRIPLYDSYARPTAQVPLDGLLEEELLEEDEDFVAEIPSGNLASAPSSSPLSAPPPSYLDGSLEDEELDEEDDSVAETLTEHVASASSPSSPSPSGASLSPSASRHTALTALEPYVQSNHSVAVFDYNGFHDEVHGAVLWTLTQFPGLNIRFYRKNWRYKFEQTIERFWAEPPRQPKYFVDDLRNDTSIRQVILTTCDWDWYKVGEDLMDIWDARSENNKFSVMCIRHFNQDHVTKDLSVFAAGRNMSIVTLGDHVTHAMEADKRRTISFLEKWQGTEPQVIGLEQMRVKTFVPIFPAQMKNESGDKLFVDQAARSEDDEGLHMAIIQSTSWDDDHRNLKGIYADLTRHFDADPTVWGYKPMDNKSDHYVPIPGHPSRFELFLVGGSRGWLPKRFSAVSMSRVGYSYPKFYGALHAADIVLPAFGKTTYDKDRASSTMGVAGTAMSPLLIPQSYAEAYGYFCPAFGIIRPANVSEIDYIAGVRRGDYSWTSRKEREESMKQCQEDWTARNMYTLAELFDLL